MDSLSKKLQNLGIHDIRNAARFAQNVIVQYEPYQVDVRRATNTDSWGPTPKHLEKVLRNRYQVPMYLLTEYILKRLIDHIASRPKNLYEKARKDYVNYGAEWRVVLKCLVVIEFLLLNVDEGDELNQVKSCLTAHKHILTREVANFKISFSNDGKMEVHERGIKRKNEIILQFLDDSQFLKKERAKNKKNAMKIRNNNLSGGLNNSGAGASSSASGAHPSYSGDHITSAQGFDYDFDDEDGDEFNDFSSASGVSNNNNSTNNSRRGAPTSLEEQRRQRREILRERIKSTEQQRKNREQIKKQQEEEQNVPDLLDLDFDAPVSTPSTDNNISKNTPVAGTTNLNVSGSVKYNNNDDDDNDDDGFGDFQSEPTTQAPINVNSNINTNSSTLNDLLGGKITSTTTTSTNNNNNNNNNTTSLNDKDLFADLFNNSKSLI